MQAANAVIIPPFAPDDESTDEEGGGHDRDDISLAMMLPQYDLDEVNAGIPILDVYHVCQEVRLQHPSDTARFSGNILARGEIDMLRYTKALPGATLEVKFYSRYVNRAEHISVRVIPAEVFQEKILPGNLGLQAQANTRGFLDHPANTIPFTDLRLRLFPGGPPLYEFTLTGSANIMAATRLLLNNLVFVD